MSIIVTSNQARVRARVNSKMLGRDPLVVYCTLPLIVMQGYHTTTEDIGSLVYNLVLKKNQKRTLVIKKNQDTPRLRTHLL